MVPKLLGVTPHRAAQDLGFYVNANMYARTSANITLSTYVVCPEH